ncbi:crystallin J1A-like [Arapaima gigas]
MKEIAEFAAMAAVLSDRILGSIVGSAVADAAAQPLHWVYDLQKLNTILTGQPNPEFYPQPANPFYRRETGQQSCYGDQAYVLLESLSECGGLNVHDVKQRFYKFFGPGSEYDTPVNDPYRDKGGPRPQLPIKGPWRHASLKNFLKNMDAGREATGCDVDNQIDGVTKLAPLVALYAGKPEMLEKVEDATRVTQNNDMCVAITLAAARFVEHYILNGPDPKVLDSVMEQLNNPNRKNPKELDRTCPHFLRDSGSVVPAPGLPAAFQAALHGVLTACKFDDAIRDTMCCGGCTCSRGSFIGACLGAQVGLQGIPDSWKDKTLRYPTVLEYAKKIVSLHQM